MPNANIDTELGVEYSGGFKEMMRMDYETFGNLLSSIEKRYYPNGTHEWNKSGYGSWGRLNIQCQSIYAYHSLTFFRYPSFLRYLILKVLLYAHKNIITYYYVRTKTKPFNPWTLAGLEDTVLPRINVPAPLSENIQICNKIFFTNCAHNGSCNTLPG